MNVIVPTSKRWWIYTLLEITVLFGWMALVVFIMNYREPIIEMFISKPETAGTLGWALILMACMYFMPRLPNFSELGKRKVKKE
jgi:Na+-driven multidrug efflux pump